MRSWLLPVGCVIFFLLFFACLWQQARTIPRDLTTRSQEALTESGLSSVRVEFDGRDAILRGSVGSAEQAQQAQAIVASVWGVRSAVQRIDLTEPTGTPPSEPASITPSDQERVTGEALETTLTSLLEGKAINFETGSAVLSAPARELLIDVAASIKKSPGFAIEIEGHTDNVGDPASNLSLSQRRAEAVRAFLISQQIPAGSLTARGYGDSRPVASNDSAAGRNQNRRIEFRVEERN